MKIQQGRNRENKPLNFAVGPVMMSDEVLEIGSQQIPYFRTAAFSEIVKYNERMYLSLLNAPENSRAVFLTGSGTSAMEAAVINTLDAGDRVLVVNGGTFGSRFCDICDIHSIPHDVIKCEYGKTLTREQLFSYNAHNYTAFLVNLCETSTGVLYDLNLISEFCRLNNIFLIVDAVSAFLCDRIDMSESCADIVITGSQKALALAPGLSLLALNERAVDRVLRNNIKSLYFDLKAYLKDGERGQTQFTPAVGTLLQLHGRLKQIERDGGTDGEIAKCRKRAKYFRDGIKKLPISMFADSPSDCVTSLVLSDTSKSAYNVFETLMNDYNIWVCPNGGELRDKVFRVGHMGALDNTDYDRLIEALGAFFAVDEKVEGGKP